MCTRLCNSLSDQTNAIPHWLWNQPSAPPVHPEDGVKGCLGNAMKVSEPQKMSSCHSQINLARLYPLQAKSTIMLNSSRSWNHGLMIFKYFYYITRKQPCKSVQAVYQWVEHVYKIVQLIQWSDKCDTSLAVESALCTTGSPRRWSQRVSRKCYESVGAAKMSSCHSQINLARLYPLQAKSIMLNSSRSWNHGLMIFTYLYYITRKQPCKSVQAVYQWVEHVYKIVQLIQWSDKCDTSLAVESALCTTGSPRRWSQRVSRKCYESVGAAKSVIMPLPNQLGKALPSESKINNAEFK